MVHELIKHYIWLIDTIARTRDAGISYQQINDKWQKSSLSDGNSYPWRTFQNHKKCVEDIFGIEIKCRKSENVYYIDDDDELKNAKGFQKWMLETISINNTIPYAAVFCWIMFLPDRNICTTYCKPCKKIIKLCSTTVLIGGKRKNLWTFLILNRLL